MGHKTLTLRALLGSNVSRIEQYAFLALVSVVEYLISFQIPEKKLLSVDGNDIDNELRLLGVVLWKSCDDSILGRGGLNLQLSHDVGRECIQ